MSLSPFSKLLDKCRENIDKLADKARSTDKAQTTTVAPATTMAGGPTPTVMGTPTKNVPVKEFKDQSSARGRRRKTASSGKVTREKDKDKKKEDDKDKDPPQVTNQIEVNDDSKKKIKKKKKSSLPRASNAHEERIKWCNSAVDKGVRDLQAEFQKLKTFGQDTIDAPAFYNAANADKNRYKDIVCLEATRVRLKNDEYIHANYVGTAYNVKRFVCTQAPLDNTVQAFWQMVIQEECEAILMLCNFIENDVKKCATYYPSKAGQALVFGDYKVSNARQYPLAEEPNILISVLSIKIGNSQSRNVVKHYQWTNWPDRGVPEVSMTAMNLLSSVRGSKKPIVVHCSAGIGRTGCIVLMEQFLERMLNGQNCEDGSEVLKDLRRQRYASVQNEMQYLFVYRSLLHYFITRNTIDMSQKLLEFIDDYDSAQRKFMIEEKEKQEKKALERKAMNGGVAPVPTPVPGDIMSAGGGASTGGGATDTTTPQQECSWDQDPAKMTQMTAFGAAPTTQNAPH